MTLIKKNVIKSTKEEKKKTQIKKIERGVFKQTFADISLLYRNFFHWNISKLIFFLYRFLLIFISILPLALIYYIYIGIY
jgi:hypothetical protein